MTPCERGHSSQRSFPWDILRGTSDPRRNKHPNIWLWPRPRLQSTQVSRARPRRLREGGGHSSTRPFKGRSRSPTANALAGPEQRTCRMLPPEGGKQLQRRAGVPITDKYIRIYIPVCIYPHMCKEYSLHAWGNAEVPGQGQDPRPPPLPGSAPRRSASA